MAIGGNQPDHEWEINLHLFIVFFLLEVKPALDCRDYVVPT